MTNDPTDDAVVIERTLDAPPPGVWRMWTDPEHFAAWYGPDGVTVPVVEMDVRVGGRRRLCMEVATPDGPRRMWFAGEFLEVVEPHRLVYTDWMSDEHGEPLPPDAPGVPEGHPSTTRVTVELEPVDAGTRLVLTHAGIPTDSPGATGWASALDALAARLVAGVA